MSQAQSLGDGAYILHVFSLEMVPQFFKYYPWRSYPAYPNFSSSISGRWYLHFASIISPSMWVEWEMEPRVLKFNLGVMVLIFCKCYL